MPDIAVVYNDNDNCVVKTSLEITKDNAKELEGKKVGVPIGTAAHYGFLKQMAHFGVDASTMKSSTWHRRTSSTAFCQAISTWLAAGVAHCTSHEGAWQCSADRCGKGRNRHSVYDVTSVPATFAAEEFGAACEVPESHCRHERQMGQGWSGCGRSIPVIAKDAGMGEADTTDTMKGFQFPTVEEQLSAKWLDGGTQAF
ncbi:MAG: hypothetical protein R3D29_14225 [Nitratireductor sp.]